MNHTSSVNKKETLNENFIPLHIRFLAAQLYIIVDESDNFQLNSKQNLQKYVTLAYKLYPALEEFIALLENNEIVDEEKFQYQTFEIAKKNFNKDELSFFFSSIYSLIFKQKSGPKLSSMIFMLGREKASEILRHKLYNFDFG